MWYNLYLLASMLTSFLESSSISMKIIIQSMHGNDQETATEITDLTSSVSRYIQDLPNFPKFTKTISEQKCMEYVYEMLKRQENKTLEYSGSQDVSINGKVVREAEFPHMGALGWWSWGRYGTQELVFLCGASLISESFMLTAAHCGYANSSSRLVQHQPYLVRLGIRYIVNSRRELAKNIRIRNFICHPSYDSETKHFDIALVELVERVDFTKSIQPACLPSRRNYGSSDKATATELIGTGWGSVKARKNGYAMSNELRSVKVHVIDRIMCDELLKKYKNRDWTGLQPHQMCAGELDGSADTCQGDSGGPLQYLLVNTTSGGNIHRIMYVTSYEVSGDCATAYAPGIYTDISYYYIIAWIESIVWPGGQQYRKNV